MLIYHNNYANDYTVETSNGRMTVEEILKDCQKRFEEQSEEVLKVKELQLYDGVIKNAMLYRLDIEKIYIIDFIIDTLDMRYCNFESVNLESSYVFHLVQNPNQRPIINNLYAARTTFKRIYNPVKVRFGNFVECDFIETYTTDIRPKHIHIFTKCEFIRDFNFELRNDKIENDAPLACPSFGNFTAWKSIIDIKTKKVYLAKLLIPSNAKRTSLGMRCRANKVKLVAILSATTGKKIEKIKELVDFTPIINKRTTYVVGNYTLPDSYDENRHNTYSHGIHFFVDQKQAIERCKIDCESMNWDAENYELS